MSETSLDTNAGASTDVNPGTSADTNAGASADTNAGASADTNAGASADTNAGASADTNAGASADTNAGASADTNAGTSADTNAGTSADTNATNAGASADTNAGASADTNAGASADTNAGTSADTNAGTSADTNAGASADTNAGASADTNAGASADANAEANLNTPVIFDVVFSTEDPLLTPLPDGNKRLSILSHSPDDIQDLRNINVNGAVLYNHDLTHVIGNVVDGSAYIDYDRRVGVAQIVFDELDPFVQDLLPKIRRGVVNKVSLGFVVLDWFYRDDDVAVITNWRVYEISVSPNPMDSGASIRELNNRSNIDNMCYRSADIVVRSNNNNNNNGVAFMKNTDSDKIKSYGKAYNIADDKVNAAISLGLSPDKAREHFNNLSRENVRSVSSITYGESQFEKKNKALAEALMINSGMVVRSNTSSGMNFGSGNPYVHLSMAEWFGEVANTHVSGRNIEQLRSVLNMVTRSSSPDGTSDFGNVITNVVHIVKDSAPFDPPWGCITNFRVMSNLANVKTVSPTDLSSAKLIPEGGEYPIDHLGQMIEEYRLDKYGKNVVVTLESTLRNDWHFFAHIPDLFYHSMNESIEELFYSNFLNLNLTMSDGKPVFSPEFNNYSDKYSFVSPEALDDAFVSFTRRDKMCKDVGYIICPSRYRTAALVLVKSAALVGSSNSGTYNPWNNVEIIPSGYLDQVGALKFIAVGESAFRKPPIEVAFLGGNRQGNISTHQDPSTDTIEVKITNFIGTKIINRNPLYLFDCKPSNEEKASKDNGNANGSKKSDIYKK